MSGSSYAVAALALSGALLAAGCSSSSSGSSASGGGKTVNWATCVSVAKCGGMSALVAAARKEGTLNVITLPSNWANYGNIMKDFTAKYGIKINDANPEGGDVTVKVDHPSVHAGAFVPGASVRICLPQTDAVLVAARS